MSSDNDVDGIMVMMMMMIVVVTMIQPFPKEIANLLLVLKSILDTPATE
jgi:hypothetical protein